MSRDLAWNGKRIDEMNRIELVQALKSAVRLIRSVGPNTFIRPDLEIAETPTGTLVA